MSNLPPLPPGFILVPETAQQSAMPAPPPGFEMVAEPQGASAPSGPMGAGQSGIIGAAQGATFGFADEAVAGLGYLLDKLPGERGRSYEELLNTTRGAQHQAEEEHPYVYTAGQIAGGLTGGVGLAKNGVTLAGRVGPGLLPRMAGYGAEGAAYGAVQGFGSGEGGAENRLSSAGTGAAWGGMLGGALPAAGSAVGALVRGGQAVAGPGIEGAGRTASALLRGAAQADEAGLRSLEQLGPDALLVDAGPSMLGLGQGAGTGTGPGRSQLVNALRDRDKGTNARILSTLDEQLGPAPAPNQIRAGLDESAEQIGERYAAPFSEASRVDTRGLAQSLDQIATRIRGPAQDAVRTVRGYLDAVRDPSAPPPQPGQRARLETDPRVLFETRQAIDGLLTNEVDPKAIRQLTIARQSVDELLQHSVPRIKEVDAPFAEVARQNEALTRGGQVFDTGKTAMRPAELADDLQQSALPQGEFVGPSGAPYRLRQGARAEIDRIVGTNPNDLNAVERKLGTADDWNAQKFGAVFGEPQRDAVMDALATNRKFRQSFQDIVQNSQTAQRQAAQKSMDGEIEIPLDTTLAGTAAAGTRAIWRALMGISKEATKDEIGTLLSAKGEKAQRIMAALLHRNEQTKRNASIARALIANSGSAAVVGQYAGQRRDR